MCGGSRLCNLLIHQDVWQTLTGASIHVMYDCRPRRLLVVCPAQTYMCIKLDSQIRPREYLCIQHLGSPAFVPVMAYQDRHAEHPTTSGENVKENKTAINTEQ
ncbi:hypothetical protein GDO86_006813 [Hymenochirus boettgeri]|uniref:Uncharacterized protein n=1 Tax=Hymenochirus boettgeri TaxID=247094 RepID=A0A8T2JFG3_9PIPI|nr:hypothetical protein GDO86_006813 [Hymenochirus boettgeri]